MQIKTGYLYHIKDDYFKKVNDENIMSNHEYRKKRPTYFTIKDNDILWFIPLSSKVDKYQKLLEKKVQKYGTCDSIIIAKIVQDDSAILLQNAFPTLEKYIDHIHMINGAPAKVGTDLQKEILLKFKRLIKLNDRGIKVFFTDVDKLKQQMLDEINGKK